MKRLILTVAENEVVASVRNKWTHIFTVIFAILTFAISYFGLSASGYSGAMQGFSRTTISLLNLVLYLVPLISLVVGILSFSEESGVREILLSQPVERSEVIIGKFIGLAGVLFTSMAFGFGLSGFLILIRVGPEGVFRFLALVVFSELLGFVFLGMAVLISIVARQKNRAFGISVLVWFVFLILYDLVIIGATTLLRGKVAAIFAMISLLGNPVDIVRVSSLISLNSPEVFGPAGAALMRFLGGSVLTFVILTLDLLAWIFVLLFVSIKIFKKQDVT